MNILMLRGQIPQDRNPNEIVFDKIEDVDDVWSQLVFAMVGKKDYGEVWYWDGTREHKFTSNFTERWIPSFENYSSKFINPDVIFCRGGFVEYHTVLNRFPDAVKIYYGAGRRFLPQPGFFDYDIILQDSQEQVDVCKQKYPFKNTTLYIKPAADNIFYPHDVEKKYDICFPANGAQVFKGHKFVYSTAPSHLKILNLGNKSKLKTPNNVTSYRVVRPEMAEHVSMCKVGIVTVQSNVDSCPRVLPELLSCGIPVVILDRARFWRNKYIVSGVTGELATENNFWDVVKHVLANVTSYRPREYYNEHLSLKHASDFLRDKIRYALGEYTDPIIK